jgi:hypothetical protein
MDAVEERRQAPARRCAAAACAATVLGLALAGCGAQRFDGSVYRGEGFAFQLGPLPAAWERLDVSDAALAFRDAESDAHIMIHARCGLDGDDVPLPALTNHLFLQFTEREIARQEVVAFDGREALHTELTAKLDGVPRFYDVWVLKKDGCVYDLLYLAPPAEASRGLERFRSVVGGFATVNGDGD